MMVLCSSVYHLHKRQMKAQDMTTFLEYNLYIICNYHNMIL